MKKILFLLITVIFLTSCDYSDFESELLVGGIAFDITENGEYEATAEIITANGEQNESKIVSNVGKTPLAAIRGMISKSSKKLYFGHCKILTVSEDVAKSGIEDILGLVFRDREIRFSMNIAVSYGCKASDLLKTKPIADKIVSFGLTQTVSEAAEKVGSTPDIRIYQMINNISSESGMSCLPAFSKDNGNIASLDGVAVFTGDKMTDYIQKEVFVFCMIASGRFNGGIITCDIDGKNMTLNIIKSKIERKTEGETVKITVKMKASFTESADKIDGKEAERLERELGDFIAESVDTTVKNVLNDCGNIFGFDENVTASKTEVLIEMQDSGLSSGGVD